MPGYDRFVTLVDELRVCISSMERKLDRRLPTLPNGEEKKRIIRELEGELEESQRLLREMQLEADADLQVPSSYRQQLTTQIKDFRAQVEQLRVRVTKVKAEDQNRGTLSDGRSVNQNPFFDPQETANRSRLLQGRAVLERTSDSLGRSLAIASETERVGGETVGELHHQRESLEHTRARLEETNQDLSKSRGIIRSMGRRVVTNKLFLMIIILLEVGILGGVVYYKYFSK
ncbi:putative Vesicle transport through interaction with t-SNAREs-like protein 1B [Hypsibius exemplaris]|uniref:Vesicle transport through interaction with t-SNAREs-like protein 1B n=1 Tax=Hypsibius exemplaris TaxID=2072580 RepID=A0A9X6RLW5_HYPEX|nr:putative Vesicle transport through interaction with t-SNAREs-like protein 1B [Hypsibius exemplaris]